MPRSALFVLTLALLLALPAAAQNDGKTVEGTWKVVNYVIKDKAAAKEVTRDLVLVIEGNQMKVFQEDKVIAEAEIKLDPSKKPATIDIIDVTGPNKGRLTVGIYELDGNKLRTCFYTDNDGKKRPTNFTNTAEAPVAIVEMERVKK